MKPKILRKLKSRFLRYREEGPPILIFALRRGGSTMVADAVAANRGIWYANEPYAMFPGRAGYAVKSKRLFRPMHSHYFGLEGRQLEEFASFSSDLLQVKIPQMGTARWAAPGLLANRVCLKILNAPWMLPWFQENSAAHIICLTRHPGAQARSVMRLGWDYPLEAYLKNSDALSKYFSTDQITFAESVFESGDIWRTAIVDWIITSKPLRVAQGERVVRVKYEDVVAGPDAFIDETLVKKCGLHDRGEMEKALLQPSGSSHLSTSKANSSIALRDVDKMINGWRNKVSDEELKAGQEILDRFEVEEYSFL